MDSVENPVLKETIEPENDLKNQLVEYVGEKLNPEDGNVTVEMLIEVMSQEFPEFLLALAEENWILGYQQAMTDIQSANHIHKKIDNG
jgi:hypothetical protein